MTEGNQHRDTRYIVQKNREHCDIFGNFHHAEARFVSYVNFPLEIGSCVCARDEGLVTGKELLSIADAEGKNVFPCKEVGEFPSGVFTRQCRLCPTLASAQNVPKNPPQVASPLESYGHCTKAKPSKMLKLCLSSRKRIRATIRHKRVINKLCIGLDEDCKRARSLRLGRGMEHRAQKQTCTSVPQMLENCLPLWPVLRCNMMRPALICLMLLNDCCTRKQCNLRIRNPPEPAFYP